MTNSNNTLPSSAKLPKELCKNIEEALQQKRKIQAIKYYRDFTGVGLKDAKDAVEAWKIGVQPLLPGTQKLAPVKKEQDPQLIQSIDGFLQTNQKIQAIKYYRNFTGVGLKDAKNAIDNWKISPQKTLDTSDLPKKVLEILQQKGKIPAIKHYRQMTGTGLKEAKETVEAWERESKTSSSAQTPVKEDTLSFQKEIDDILQQGSKILAIKRYRQVKGCGLKEAKDAIDNWKISPQKTVDTSPFDDPDFCYEIEILIRRHLRMEAYRRYQEKSGIDDPQKAKDAIDAWASNLDW